MHKHFEEIIKAIGENLEREGLIKTPMRAAKAFKYLTEGYQKSLALTVNDALFHSDAEGMVVIKDIEFYSLCEHHLLPFTGKCHIGYLPRGKVLGLSKLPRIVDMFAQRLQLQENLTQEIAEAILEVTGAKGVGVIIEASHFCMMMRGVKKQNALMKTAAMLGDFKTSPAIKNEFLELLKD